jgi:acid phosphatase
MKPVRSLSSALALVLSIAFAALFTPRPSAAQDVPRMDHVVLVVMENHSYEEVRTLPYISSLITQYTSFSQSYAVTHPSQPNYLALWAASTLDVTDDACPPAGAPYSAANLGSACEEADLKWKSYCEDLPATGSSDCANADNSYRRKHQPCPSFSNVKHKWECSFLQLAEDIAEDELPAFSFVVPNMCNDMHDCAADSGDAWLAKNLPAMIEAVGPRGLVILTWDEDDKSSSNHILTVFAGQQVKSNYVSSQPMTHYTVVRTICDALGLETFANASSAAPPSDVWTGVPSTGVAPPTRSGVNLSQPSPNPFSSEVTASLALPSEQLVRAFVVDCSGRRVRSLFAEPRIGTSTVSWDGLRDDGRRAAAGLYFLCVSAGHDQAVQRLALTR